MTTADAGTAESLPTEIHEQPTAQTGCGARWALLGNDTDADSAWDKAKDQALTSWGATFTGTDAFVDDFAVSEIPQPEDAVRRLADLDGLHAHAVGNARDWALRRARVALTDTGLVFPEWAAGDEPMVLGADADVDAAVQTALDEAGKGLADGEVLARITLVGLRQRSKVAVSRFPAPSARAHVVVTGERILSRHGSSTEARAAAKETAAVHGQADVWVLAGRTGGAPLLRAQREIVAQRATVTVVVARLRNPDRNRIASWLFSGPATLA